MVEAGMGKRRRLVLLFAVVLFGAAIALPSLLTVQNELTNPFVYRHIAYVEVTRTEGKLVETVDTGRGFYFGFTRVYPGLETLHLIVATVTGMQGKELQLFPIMGIILSLLFFAVAMKLTKLSFESYFLALVVFGFGVAFHFGWYNIWYYSITPALFLTFLLLFIKYCSSGGAKGTTILLLLALVFVAALLTHHRVPTWMIMVPAFTFVVGLLRPRERRLHAGPSLLLLATTFAVAYLQFNQIIYSEYLPRSVITDPWYGATSLFLAFYGSILGVPAEIEPYLLGGGLLAQSQAAASLWLQLAILLITLGPVALFVARSPKLLRQQYKGAGGVVKDDSEGVAVLVGLALCAVIMVDVFFYAVIGRINLLMYALMSPLIALVAIKSFGSRRLFIMSFVALLSILTVARFSVVWIGGDFSPEKTTYEDLVPSGKWLASHSTITPRIMTDMHTFGRYLVNSAAEGKSPGFIYYTPENYAAIVEHKRLDTFGIGEGDFLAVDIKSVDKSLVSLLVWNFFTPIGEFLPQIEKNPSLDAVYSDGAVLLFAFKEPSR